MAAVLSPDKPGAGKAQAARPGRPHPSQGHPLLPYGLLLRAPLSVPGFRGYPLLRELMLSFPSTSLLSPAQGEWVGLQNYVDLWSDPDFHRVIWTTLLYTVA